MINLEKPIVFFDLETTGVNTQRDRIVQISAIKIFNEERVERNMTLDPEMPIPTEASEVHGITDEMVQGKLKFKQVCKGLYNFLDGCDIAGYNSDNFDVPLLSAEFLRTGITWPRPGTKFIDVLKIERLVDPHTLENTYLKYMGKELEGAHDANADTKATIDVFLEQLKRFDLPDNASDLQDYVDGDKIRVDLAGKLYKNTNGQVCYAIGKDKDKVVIEERGFGLWMLKNDFPEETKSILKNLLS